MVEPGLRRVMVQHWRDLLFAHWPVDPAPLEARLPEGLTLDRYDGEAWLGVVPFRMDGVRLPWLPPVPGTSAFPELNLRTYVTRRGRAGGWFLSLDAANALAVAVARRWFHLPYFRADMSCRPDPPVGGGGGDGGGEPGIAYASRRTHRGAPAAEFVARYRPTGPVAPSVPGSLDAFLTERYSLFTADDRGRVIRGDIEHVPWPLQPAEAEIEVDSMAAAAGLALPDTPPRLAFARHVAVDILAPGRD